MDLHHETVGEGEPLVLLNGIMMTTRSWALMTPRLARSFRCILHDFRGQLLSPKPPGPYAMEQHVDDLVDLLDALGVEKAHVVGTSYGGEVGMLFALAHPERVRTLSLIACVSHVEPPLRSAVEMWRDVARLAPETLYDVSAPYNFSDAFRTAEVMEQGRARLAAYGPEFFRAFADLCDAFLRLDITSRLDAIRCPTLVVCGELDALKPVHYSRTIASRIPGAELVIVPNAGHAVVVEKPDAVNDVLLQFLDSSRP